MRKTKKIMKEIEIIEDFLCNKCGESCVPKDCWKQDCWKPNPDYYGLIEVSFSTGYLSEKFPDAKRYTFSLCEKCLAKLFKTFKIKPEEENMML